MGSFIGTLAILRGFIRLQGRLTRPPRRGITVPRLAFPSTHIIENFAGCVNNQPRRDD